MTFTTSKLGTFMTSAIQVMGMYAGSSITTTATVTLMGRALFDGQTLLLLSMPSVSVVDSLVGVQFTTSDRTPELTGICILHTIPLMLWVFSR